MNKWEILINTYLTPKIKKDIFVNIYIYFDTYTVYWRNCVLNSFNL